MRAVHAECDGEAELHDAEEPAGGHSLVRLDVVEHVDRRLFLLAGDEFLQVGEAAAWSNFGAGGWESTCACALVVRHTATIIARVQACHSRNRIGLRVVKPVKVTRPRP